MSIWDWLFAAWVVNSLNKDDVRQDYDSDYDSHGYSSYDYDDEDF